MNFDDLMFAAIINRQVGSGVEVSIDGSERVAPMKDEDPPQVMSDGSLRIGITTGPQDAQPIPEDIPQEFKGTQGVPLEQFATTVADVPAGLLKGAVEGTIGLPGDIIALGKAIAAAASPNQGEDRIDAFLRGIGDPVSIFGQDIRTEGISKILEGVFGPVVPEGVTDQTRKNVAGASEFVGQLGGAGKTVVATAKTAAAGAKDIPTAFKQLVEAGKDIPIGLSTKAVGGTVEDAIRAAKPLTITGMDQQRMSVATKIVTDGVKSGMSPTKMIQAIEKQTGMKVTGKQQKEIKQYVSDVAPKGQIYSDQAFKDLIAQPFPFEPSTQRFAESFDNAFAWLKTLDAQGLRDAAILSDQRLAPILGVAKDGKAKRLLATNGKLLKTETGVPGGVPVELPDGRNIESAGLAISPAYKTGKFSTCPNSASCAQECLGKTSGGYFAYGGGADLEAMKGTRLRSFRMTQAMFREPEAFAIKLHNEIISLKNKAAKGGNAFAVRLNVLSDIDPRVHKSLIEAHPDVFYYDYTKMKYRPVAPNHHYTYSSTGASQKAGQNGLTVDVDNPHTNWIQMRTRLDEGYNVAMAFSSKKALPESVLDEATGKTYRVIDGDAYDFRPLDAQPAGSDGVIIGLKNKAMTRKESAAASDSNGFFVQYDPKLGTQVVIPPQKREAIMIQSGNEQAGFSTGEQVTGEMK